jgi:23S rRNA pseudouridine955/2504/2580 synthase
MIASLHEDGEILVLDKPAGLAVQPGEGVHTCLLDVVERDFGFRPFLVHRLDKETAGLIIVARDAKSAARWTKALGSREVGKFYRAVTSGSLEGPSGRITTPVRVRGESVPADTGWRLLARFGGFSWLELELGSGRTHQIRLHLAEAGCPILGDDRHGDFALNRALRKEYGLRRLLLVSWRLVLPGGRTLQAALPEHFAAFFGRFPDAPGPELA